MMSALLEVEKLSIRFGGIHAVQAVDLIVEPGEVVGIIGPNGAGKTTLLNAVNQLVVSEGRIVFAARNIQGLAPHRLRPLGLARSFQQPQLSPSLTVRANLMLGLAFWPHYSWLTAAYLPGTVQRVEGAMYPMVERIAELCGLTPWLEERAQDVPYGVLKAADIARSLVGDPQLVLLDEPFGGLSADEKDRLVPILRGFVAEGGRSILLIDHDVEVVTRVCDRLYAMDYGKVLTHGAPQEVIDNEMVIQAYLGTEA
jgi:branched-chain amino acid transport system ATP-binding protein